MSNLLLTFAIPDGTGANRMMCQFALALRAAGHNVVLAHGDSTSQSSVLPDASLRLLAELESAGIKCIACQGFRRLFSSRVTKRLIAISEEHSIDAVIGFQQLDRKYALSLARHLNIPCIISAQNKHTFWGTKPVAWLKHFVYSRMLRRNANLVICTSGEVRREILNEMRIPEERTILIPNGVRIHEDFLDASIRRNYRHKLGLEDDETILLNVGRIDLQKGQDILVEALATLVTQADARLPKWKLLLAGDLSSGPIADKMKSYIEQLHTRIDECGLSDRVSFLGWRDDIRELLTAADVYVHPSRWEGWPLAVMEAMGEAKPIVTSDCVGEPEGFKAGIHGYIFRNKDVNELTKCLQRVLARNDYKTMGVACRDLARANYDIAVLSRRFVEAVESTIESSSNSHPST